MRMSGVAVLAAAALIWSQSERPDVLVSDTGTLVGVMTPQGRALNKPKGDGFVGGAWLENDGDAADQEQASTRAGFTRKEARIELGETVIRFSTRKDWTPSEIRQLCDRADLLVLPHLNIPADCEVITTRTLKQSGSLAINLREGDLDITRTNDLRGARLWVH